MNGKHMKEFVKDCKRGPAGSRLAPSHSSHTSLSPHEIFSISSCRGYHEEVKCQKEARKTLWRCRLHTREYPSNRWPFVEPKWKISSERTGRSRTTGVKLLHHRDKEDNVKGAEFLTAQTSLSTSLSGVF